MIVRAPHLQDERLFDCYDAERRGDTPDLPAAEHLADCDPCRRRYAELSQFLTTLRAEADAETDAVFTAERLRTQQQEIARRLEGIGRAARVISFPGRAASRPSPMSTARLATRWVAAAAAAGLFVGVAAGSVFSRGSRFDFAKGGRWNAAQATHQRSGGGGPAMLAPVTNALSSGSDTDDVFMSDLETALDRPHTSELGVFDALTPHVREIIDVHDRVR